MKKKILAGLLLAGSTMFAAPRVSFGIISESAGRLRLQCCSRASVPWPRLRVPGWLLAVSAVAVDWHAAIGARPNISRILTGTPNIFAVNGGAASARPIREASRMATYRPQCGSVILGRWPALVYNPCIAITLRHWARPAVGPTSDSPESSTRLWRRNIGVAVELQNNSADRR